MSTIVTATPARLDLDLQRGNSVSIPFDAKDSEGAAVDFAGWSFRLRAVWRGHEMIKDTSVADSGFEFDGHSQLVLRFTPEESRSFPSGKIATYEIEVRLAPDVELTAFAGFIIGNGGVNDDRNS